MAETGQFPVCCLVTFVVCGSQAFQFFCSVVFLFYVCVSWGDKVVLVT